MVDLKWMVRVRNILKQTGYEIDYDFEKDFLEDLGWFEEASKDMAPLDFIILLKKKGKLKKKPTTLSAARKLIRKLIVGSKKK